MDAGGLKERPHFGRVSERRWVFWKGIGTRVGFMEGARKRVASARGLWLKEGYDCYLVSTPTISFKWALTILDITLQQ